MARPKTTPHDEDQQGALSQRLYTHVERLAGLIGPRHVGRPRTMQAAATYVATELEGSGYPVESQLYDADGCEVANIVAQCSGSSRCDEIVIVGAHYDTVSTTPGADDNASGVAVLLELARLLQKHSFRRTLRFVAFACEEPPHYHMHTMGSQVYARSCRERGERVVGMICLEMVGYYTTQPKSQRVPPAIPRVLHWAFPRRGDFLAAVGNFRSWRLVWTFRSGFKRAVRFPLFTIVLPERISEIRMSDNSSFWDQGYPALMVTDTSFLRNPHYHLTTDVPETLDYPRIASVTIGVAGAVAQLAKAATKFHLP